MALMILAHMDFDYSVANKAISAELVLKMLDLEIRNIHHYTLSIRLISAPNRRSYSGTNLLSSSTRCYWFNMPAILKIWFD